MPAMMAYVVSNKMDWKSVIMENLSGYTVKDIIKVFAMERHPLSGWFSLHYSDSEISGRPKISSAYYLLSGEEPLPWHKSDAIEIWSHLMGAPVECVVTNGGRMRVTGVLGCDLAQGQRPQMAVPAYHSQSLRSLGVWSLLGCASTPGYSPRAGFVMDADN